MNVVVTGAGRGIGLGFVRHYLSGGAKVWACYRSDNSQLEEIASSSLQLVQWDVAEDQDDGFVADAGFPNAIDLLINNAGVYGPKKEAGQSLNSVSPAAILDVMNINCVGAVRVVQALKSRVIATAGKIANISSKMGSSEDNTSGGCYAYRASKACLISVSKSMAVDLAPMGVRVVTLHPGWVRTEMTSYNGLIDIDVSVAGMAGVIEAIDGYKPGALVAFDGKLIPY